MVRDEQPQGSRWRVGIVVPARNEEALIGRCLDGLAAAIERLHRERPGCQVTTVVVLDSCADGTARVVAGYPWVEAVEVSACSVGVARDVGVRAVAATVPRARARRADPTARVWIANTDADSVVPADWLTTALDLADAGFEVVTGTVTMDPHGAGPEVLALVAAATPLADGHPHIHGANLGFTLRAYLECGGFAPLTAHEDVAFVHGASSRGLRSHATARASVLTSTRLMARAPDGFARYLRDRLGSAEPEIA